MTNELTKIDNQVEKALVSSKFTIYLRAHDNKIFGVSANGFDVPLMGRNKYLGCVEIIYNTITEQLYTKVVGANPITEPSLLIENNTGE